MLDGRCSRRTFTLQLRQCVAVMQFSWGLLLASAARVYKIRHTKLSYVAVHHLQLALVLDTKRAHLREALSDERLKGKRFCCLPVNLAKRTVGRVPGTPLSGSCHRLGTVHGVRQS